MKFTKQCVLNFNNVLLNTVEHAQIGFGRVWLSSISNGFHYSSQEIDTKLIRGGILWFYLDVSSENPQTKETKQIFLPLLTTCHFRLQADILIFRVSETVYLFLTHILCLWHCFILPLCHYVCRLPCSVQYSCIGYFFIFVMFVSCFC